MARTVIKVGRLIDGLGNPVKESWSLVIEGERIAELGPSSSAKRLPGDTVISAETLTAVPGFIDAHVHTRSNAEGWDNDRFTTTIPEFAFRSMLNAQKTLVSGVTAIRDMASIGYVDIALRDHIEKGLIDGPTMRVSGHGLTMWGGHMHGVTRPEVIVTDQTGVCNTPDEAKKAARYQIMRGVDIIKLNASDPRIPGLTRRPGLIWQEMDLPMIQAACFEGHKMGKIVGVHCNGSQGAWDAINGGVDTIEHGWHLTDEQLEVMAEKGIIHVPTLSPPRKRLEAREQGKTTDMDRDWDLKGVEASEERVLRAIAKGVKVAAGSDVGTLFNDHGTNIWEVIYMAEAGMKPLESIKAGTSVSAEATGIAERTGRLSAGYDADIVLLDGDPVADIRVLASGVRFVMRRGKVIVDKTRKPEAGKPEAA